MKRAFTMRLSKGLAIYLICSLVWPANLALWAADAKDQTKQETQTAVKVENAPEIKAEAKPETKVEVKPEAKVESKPEVKPESKPAPEIHHTALDHFQPSRRMRLDAEILDKSGVKIARAYFREKADDEFLFVEMHAVADKPNHYQALLPAPGSAMTQFEYLILVLDNDKKTFKSRTYLVQRKAAPAGADPKSPPVYPEWQPETPVGALPLQVKHELPGKAHIPHGFEPFTLAVAPAAERYGMAAGLYSPQAMAGVEHPSGVADGGQATTPATGITTLGWVGIGAGAAALVAGIAIAAGGGGGGGGGGEDSSSSSTPATPPVGPNIGGSWSGTLKLPARGVLEAVTARVVHEGTRVTIHTSSSQTLARDFVGHIDSRGNMSVVDQADGQHWTTYFGPADDNDLSLADYVDHERSLNSLKLAR